MSKIKFNNGDAVFFSTLRERIDKYFKQSNISPTGNYKLYSKTAILLISLTTLYTTLVFFTPSSIILSLALCVVLGVNVAAIGFNVMHDGAHGSFSKHKWLNDSMAQSLNMLGGNAYLWKQKHNINHHTYTNVEGLDDDIDLSPFVRVHEEQEKYWYHRFQHYYTLFLYCTTYLFWIFYADFRKYFTGKITETTPFKKMSLAEHFNFWISKLIYIAVFIVTPAVVVGVIPTIIAYSVMVFTTGLLIAIVFQLAHILGETQFVTPTTEATTIESEWAVHQINTTANFATNNKFISWLLGGLNFQVEHHLFPRISHVHYPSINKIVMQTCEEFGVMYKEFPTMIGAFKSHMIYLKQLSRA